MARKPPDKFDMLIDDAMRKWPETLPVLIRYNMQCIGCPLANFHTVSDAAVEHNMEDTAFLDDMAKCMN